MNPAEPSEINFKSPVIESCFYTVPNFESGRQKTVLIQTPQIVVSVTFGALLFHGSIVHRSKRDAITK